MNLKEAQRAQRSLIMVSPVLSRLSLPAQLVVGALLAIGTQALAIVPANIIEGSIKFPATVKQIPIVRVYCGGRKIPYNLCDIDNFNRQFKFQIPKSQYQRQFTILITNPKNLKFVQVDSKDLECQNTIQNIQIKPKSKYRYYQIKLEEDLPTDSRDEYAALMNIAQGRQKLNYRWAIQEQKINSPEGTIPDETIIICYASDCVAGLEALNSSELPCITMKEDMLKVVGRTSFKEFSDSFVLASLDTDTIHATIRQDNNVRREPKRTIFAASVT